MTQVKFWGLWKDKDPSRQQWNGKTTIDGKQYYLNLYVNTKKEKATHPDLNIKITPVMQNEGASSLPMPVAIDINNIPF